ncbi:hypothetical protein HK104_001831 [Borealophlyctis nickersoniae]|nr:hypothetical protein HK104_001831 [Borealophlyctis nickersoniae]
MSRFADGLINLRKVKSKIRDQWRDVAEHDGDDAMSIRKSLRKKASKAGIVQVDLEGWAAEMQQFYKLLAEAGKQKELGTFGAFLRTTERFAPFLVPVDAPPQTLTLTAKGRGIIRARTRPTLSVNGIPLLVSGTIIRHPRRVQDEDQLQSGGGGGGGDEGHGGKVRIVMPGFKREEKMEVLGFRMEMNVASALLLGGFDATKASVDSSTAVTAST